MRAINNVLVGLQARLKTRRVIGYPRHLIIDPVNTCGLQCPICPNGRRETPREPGVMTRSLFSKIMRTCGPYLYTLTLTNWGEPLRHPGILELLSIARKYPCYIGFSSNLQYLPSQLADGLIQSGIDEIGVSIDGATAEVYNRYRIGGDFETAMNNLRLLVSRRRRLGAAKPKIRWQVLLHRHTEKETDAIIDRAHDIGVDSVVFVPILVDISRMFTHTPEERLSRDSDWLPENPELSGYDYETGRLKGDPRFCSKLWDTMVIHPDGAVSPCCAVINPEDDFGAITEKGGFWKTWNGRRYRTARARMARKPAEPGNLVCDQCLRHGILIC
jgi:MoaA/NifB/PqqE/SkfB family radical SAM enzyme